MPAPPTAADGGRLSWRALSLYHVDLFEALSACRRRYEAVVRMCTAGADGAGDPGAPGGAPIDMRPGAGPDRGD